MRATTMAEWTGVVALACILLAPLPAPAIEAGINLDVHQDINLAIRPNGFRLTGRLESGPPLGEPGGGGWSHWPTLLDHVDGTGPNVFPIFTHTITPDGLDPGQNWYNFQCDWALQPGAPAIPYCNVRHLGVLFDLNCHNVVIDVVGTWTLDGMPVGLGMNQGFFPIPGFRVIDQGELQSVHLQNGNMNGVPEPGEIESRVVQMDLFAVASREQLEMLLGPEPFRQLQSGGLQASLPWVPVHFGVEPISPTNPWYFNVDSFFDVFLEMPGGPLYPQVPVPVQPGGFLLAREKLEFTNNFGVNETRWVWEYHEAHQADLGDAPDSTNSWGAGMTAYPWAVPARFPTVYRMGSPPHGPIHWQPYAAAHLGPVVTLEDEADLPPDQDGLTNFDPVANLADRDVADDGVPGIPLALPHCQPTTFDFIVAAGNSPVVMYVNAWFDWNRDADWDDVVDCSLLSAPEWAVQNMVIPAMIPNSTGTFTTPTFLSGNLGLDEPIWMRITLSELPWQPGPLPLRTGGDGPASGYTYGETEDYYFVPASPQLNGCCLPGGLCIDMLPDQCIGQSGTPQPLACTGTVEACCLSDLTCVMVDPICCDDMGGIAIGPGTTCTQPDACCLPDNTCVMVDPQCCFAVGGVAQGPGTTCSPLQACCLPDHTCVDLDPLCCVELGGTPQGDGRLCGDVTVPTIACCLSDGTCADVHPLCCDEMGGVPGYAANCLGDHNGNNIDDACEEPADGCCLFDGTCINLSPQDCIAQRGTPQGALCSGLLEACCLPDMSCAMVDPLCCDDLGGLPLGAGTVCSAPEACCTPDASTCIMADPLCCSAALGTPQGAGTICTQPKACCLPDGSCVDVDPLCCDELGGTPGFAPNCLGDLNGNDIDDACEQEPVLQPKWSQPPHEPGEGFDAASDLWLHGPIVNKVEQLPNEQWSGMHAHDSLELPGGVRQITLADDWICDGGDVTAFEWWGNYELIGPGIEARGSGISHFHLSIHVCQPGVPWCLPLDPEIWGMNVPFPMLVETDTGLINSEGSHIYHYSFTLTTPFPQDQGVQYWFDIESHSIDPGSPAQWRWQEARRDVAPPLEQAPAAQRNYLQGGPPGMWSWIQWAPIPPSDQPRYSDMAFRVISATQPLPEVNKVVADDFISDGRPIEVVRWWGSYYDPRYMPDVGTDPLHRLDGWLISFHHSEPAIDPQCPPDYLVGDPPPTALAVYFAPPEAVQIVLTPLTDCFGHPVFEYQVDLRRCCLICFEPDPRNGIIPATPAAFNEVHAFGYWLDIQAVVGATWLPLSVNECVMEFTHHLPSDQTPDGHFWGWHTSYVELLEEACTGQVVAPFLVPTPHCWNYGGWMKQPWLCPTPIMPVNMAFELLTPVLRGDCTLDGIVGLADHVVLGGCMTGPEQGPIAIGCECIDLDVDNDVDLRDFALFTVIFTGP